MLLLLLLQVAVPAAHETLSLRCTGGALVMSTTSTTQGSVYDNYGNVVSGSATTAAPVAVEMVVEFRMADGKATLRLPAVAYGENNLRGSRLEETVDRLHATDSEITGTVRVGLLSKAKFRIDRVSGEMTTRGGYRGQCVPIDTAQRAF